MLVTTTVEFAGQKVTVGAQLITVTRLVAYTVEVVKACIEPLVAAEVLMDDCA